MSYLYCVDRWVDGDGVPYSFRRFIYRKCAETGRFTRLGVGIPHDRSIWREALGTPRVELTMTSMEEVAEALILEWEKDRDANVALIDRDYDMARAATIAIL